MTIVEFFFDIRSPFSRVQHELLQRQLGHWKSMTQLRMTPVLIRKMFEASGNPSPALNPAKLTYLSRDLAMVTDYYKMDFTLPKDFRKFATEMPLENTQLFLTAIQNHLDEATFNRLVGVIFRSYFHEPPEHVWKVDVLKQLAINDGIASDIVEKAINVMKSDENQAKLQQNNDNCAKLGAFGLPVTLVHSDNNKDTWVFGSDRMHIVGRLLGEKEPPILLP
ncbi:glutathione S-transferase kappa 1-like [Dermatophagoides pteronyssinus]|uniref:Glutathione S-transferase kappa 1-like n=1 Tax=Dermatophagoides pteronyssinus TaxID=6956 RepID=A0A6P6XQN3_DERPT|nr:glutathione S-transferase kappa 1-like [Dermatophagoides pteronyssinus]